MTTTTALRREAFSVSRAAEYFDAKTLATLTGQPPSQFAAVILKELGDNALDAAESDGRSPQLEIRAEVPGDAETMILTVSDNGPGIAPDLVGRILDFETRTSDKAAYRAPTRGLQGNALKTVLGIPAALGKPSPITIESQGVRHVITATVDAAGEAVVRHHTEEGPHQPGAIIRVGVPLAGQRVDPRRWAQTFALFNPHASVRIRVSGDASYVAQSGIAEVDDSYPAAVDYPGAWRKHTARDATSPHWYDRTALSTLILRHAHATRRGAPDKPLREFVREFAGLSGTAKAKAVCDRIPGVRTLSDFDGREDAIADLLKAMQDEARVVKPDALGRVGADAFRARFDAWHGLTGDDRFWHQQSVGMAGGVPFVVEVAVADVATPPAVREGAWGVNFSPAFRDPFGGTAMAAGKISGQGIDGMLRDAGVLSRRDGATAVAVHVICPALQFLDYGKASIDPPAELVTVLQETIWKAGKTLHAEKVRRRKDAAAADRHVRERTRAQRRREWTLIDAAFGVMEEAWSKATGDGALPASGRTLFYQARPLVQQYTDKELVDTYFLSDILPRYQREIRDLPGIYFEARGTLYEPHGGREVPLGTREVDEYDFPAWAYDKVLFVEKQGLWPILKASRLAEKYDMAIIAGEGYAPVAARKLLERADRNADYRLFVLHDADPAGYNIARTLREETARMPGYRVNVIDLGLRFEDGLAHGIQPETFTRKKELPAGITDGLTERERQAFVGEARQTSSWRFDFVCERIELNALTAPEFIAYAEAGLADHGATGKIVPPDPVLADHALARLRDAMAGVIGDALASLVNVDAIVDAWLAEEIASGLTNVPGSRIADAFTGDRLQSWRTVVSSEMQATVSDAVRAGDVDERVRQAIAARS